MITIIMLTCIALIALLIGFFEIRIPFIHEKRVSNNEKIVFPKFRLKKDVKENKLPVTGLKRFLRNTKSEIGYRVIQHGKTSDVA